MKFNLIHSAGRGSLAALILALQACGGGGDGAGSIPGTASSNEAAPAPGVPAPIPTSLSPAPAPPAVAPAPEVAAPSPQSPGQGNRLIALSGATSCSLPGMREAILQQANLVRAAGRVCGTEIMRAAPAVGWNDTLFSAAARHAADMGARNYFSHTTPEGISFSQRLTAEGYSWRAAGENIAAGQVSATEVMNGWLASEGHCRNIMDPVFAEVAVACVSRSGSTYGTYWSMELGRR